MREIFRQVTFAVAILVNTSGKEIIAIIAHMLTVHTFMVTLDLFKAFITEKVSVFAVTIAHLLMASITVMLTYGLVFAVDDSVTTVATVVFVLVYVLANELSATFVAVAVIIIIYATRGDPHLAPIACMVIIVVLMPDVIEVLFTRSFLTASVAERISVIIDMMNAF